jgi:anti-sigma factor RsiW
MDEEVGERIRNEATYHAAPAHLRARILASLPRESAAPAWRWKPWGLASGLAAAFALVLAVGVYVAMPGADEKLAEDIVAAHVRSLMVDHAFDVASSDSHTVKPWFAGKLNFSPPVFDLTTQGFALVGGRLDYLDRRPVAALVYRHRQHLINLFVWPSAGEEPARKIGRQGFHLLGWAREGMNFWAVSDLNAEELAQFRAMLEKGSTQKGPD